MLVSQVNLPNAMRILTTFFLCIGFVSAKLLIDFNAARGDQPSVLGQVNLEEERNTTIKEQTADLFFKKGADWKGLPAAHVHRKAGYIRYFASD